jgi:hypothetical protein
VAVELTYHTAFSPFVVSIGLDFERSAYEPLLKTKDRDEALEAFKEKRKPVFKGE